ncbi:exonuclease SbcC [Marinitoga hydrogenitolerans DSM 16785]|uniref:Exonuclease SbcC n=1 Tax=Marinitoga hydrogenitolerans (strain DSM 16785 / JCM 12826 / AT1271) TaxID=1122195 RepID=A0A1M4W5U8_MARH1|nr:SMC family ATPase [Marinitoga hydrogenitolerans]SHE76596.1 exonuclease SbcC [Marinitoga hydrogenitolerans DSM 16785]
MKINKISLKNYRNHIDKTIEFKNGINILLGKNGSGKSSIFEALGIALFDVEPRDKNLKNAVNKEAKFSTITVEFVGNDDVEYIVEKKIGNQSKHMLKEKNGDTLSERKEYVLKKIAELAGINGKNSKEIFKNVISAYQNDLINIFNLSPSQRKELFNKIFDTEIYEKIYTHLLNSENKYKNLLSIYEEKINLLKEQLKEYNNVEEELEKINADILNLKKKIDELENQEKVFEQEIKKKDLEIKTLEKIKRNLEIKEAHLNNKQENKDKLKKQIADAQMAVEMLKSTENGYNEYIKAEKKLTTLNDSEKELIKKQKLRDKLQKKINDLETEKKVFKEKINNENKNLENIKNVLAQTDNKLVEFENKEKILQNEIEKILKKREQLDVENKLFKMDLDKYNEIVFNLSILDDEIKKEDYYKQHLEEKEKKLTKIESAIKEIKSKIVEEESLSKKFDELKLKLENLENSKKQLSNGICPILDEKCLNLEEKGGSNTYFDNSIKNLNNEIKEIKKKIQKLDNPKNKLEKELNDLNEVKSDIKTYNKYLSDIQDKKKGRENLLNQKSNLERKYGNLAEKEKELRNTSNEILKSITEIESNLKNIRKQILEMEKEKNDNMKNFNEIQNEIILLNNKKEKNIKKMEELKKEISDYENLDIELERLRKEKSNIENIKIKYKKDYEVYIENKNIAKNLEKYIKDYEDIEKEIEVIKKEIEKLKQKANNYPDLLLLEEKKKNLEKNLNSIKKILINLNSQYGSLKANKKNLEIKITEKREKEQKISKFEEEKNTNEEKYILTKEFRDKIKLMGKYVSSEFTDIISKIATENYRKISGKNENIIWSSEKEYLVILRDPVKGDREFSILSGGEQVSVAIAIRTALVNFLSKANIYILDEPTINLDEERRNMLAENLKNMLNEIEQAFIVTHDGTFSEMAENIIEITNSGN